MNKEAKEKIHQAAVNMIYSGLFNEEYRITFSIIEKQATDFLLSADQSYWSKGGSIQWMENREKVLVQYGYSDLIKKLEKLLAKYRKTGIYNKESGGN